MKEKKEKEEEEEEEEEEEKEKKKKKKINTFVDSETQVTCTMTTHVREELGEADIGGVPSPRDFPLRVVEKRNDTPFDQSISRGVRD